MSADDSYEAPIDAMLPVYVPLISYYPWTVINVLQQIIIQLMMHNYVSPLIKELGSHFSPSYYFISNLLRVGSFFCESFNSIHWLDIWIFSQMQKKINHQSAINLWQILLMHSFKLFHCRSYFLFSLAQLGSLKVAVVCL